MKELNSIEAVEVAGAGFWGAVAEGAGTGAAVGCFVSLPGAAIGGIIGGVAAGALYFL